MLRFIGRLLARNPRRDAGIDKSTDVVVDSIQAPRRSSGDCPTVQPVVIEPVVSTERPGPAGAPAPVRVPGLSLLPPEYEGTAIGEALRRAILDQRQWRRMGGGMLTKTALIDVELDGGGTTQLWVVARYSGRANEPLDITFTPTIPLNRRPS